jgi:hypothetical protein
VQPLPGVTMQIGISVTKAGSFHSKEKNEFSTEQAI